MAKIESLQRAKAVNLDFPFEQPNDFKLDGVLATSFSTLKQMIDRAVELGFNTVSFDTNVPINHLTGELMLFVPNDGNGDKKFSPEVWKAIEYAESIGLRTVIDLNIRNALNDLTITTSNVGPDFSVSKFFQSIKSFETEIAAKAQSYGVDGITVASFQFGYAVDRYTAQWSEVIGALRSVYKGTLRYSSNVEDTENPLWNLVDEIQIQLNPDWLLEPDFSAEDFVPLYLGPYIAGNRTTSNVSTDQRINELISKYPTKSVSLEVMFQPGKSAGNEFEDPWSYVFTPDPNQVNGADQSRLFPDQWIDKALNQQKISGFFEYFGNYLQNKISGVQVWQYMPWAESNWIREPKNSHGVAWQSAVRAGPALNWNPEAEEMLGSYLTKPWGFKTLHYGSSIAELSLGSEVADKFFSSAGNDTIQGGSGIDVAAYDAVRSGYRIEESSGVWFITDLRSGTNSSGVDRLIGVERLQFSDSWVAIDVSGAGGQAYRVYKAAFNREPDQGGLGYWIAQMDSGMNMVEVAARFIDSNEFRAMYGAATTDEQYLTKVYQNVLGRDPEPGGYNWWLNEMRTNPEKTRAKVLADFSESTENKAGTAQLVGQGIVFEPWVG
jgi:hypothetical protein